MPLEDLHSDAQLLFLGCEDMFGFAQFSPGHQGVYQKVSKARIKTCFRTQGEESPCTFGVPDLDDW